MKRCPECNEPFDDVLRFCELHGAELVDEPGEIREVLQPQPYKDSRDLSGVVSTIAIGMLVGIVLSLLAYVLFLSPSINNKSAEKREIAPAIATSKPNQLIATTPRERETPTPAGSPTDEETAESSSPSPTPAATASPEAPAAAMNDGPISTGTKRGETGQALIKMKDGTSVEADAAWEDSQGVWYRRGNMVSFVERQRVDKITGLPGEKSNASSTAKK